MKSLFLFALFTLCFSTLGISQDAATTVKTLSADEVIEGKNTGLFTFVFPDGTSADVIEEVSQYYVQYFTVEFDAKTSTAIVKMITNDAMSRRIITRFLTASGMQHVLVGDKLYDTQEFYENLLAD
jgi:hypothetical protein